MDFIQALGMAGMLIILTLFVLNEWGKLSTEDVRYDIGNAVGSSMLVVFAYSTDSLPFLILNLVWAAVSWKDVVSYFAGEQK